MHPSNPLRYDIVMATRNRPEAVELSLPLILAQTRLPERIVFVDSSDDPEPIRRIVEAAMATASVPMELHRSEAGLTLQRNIGIARCAADVVILPDDDSLLFPDAAAEIMDVYERDAAGRIAGVAAAPSSRPPEGVDIGQAAYEAEAPSRFGIGEIRQRLKSRFAGANPVLIVGRRLNARHPMPEWAAARDVVSVAYMTGFRMSFRRRVLTEGFFDETLRRYGWFEDIDASFSAMRQGRVVAAERAKIYHHRHAGKRANGFTMGRWAILNNAYIILKHVRANPEAFPAPGREVWRLWLFSLSRALCYLPGARDRFGVDRFLGSLAGLRSLASLVRSRPDRLADAYNDVVRE